MVEEYRAGFEKVDAFELASHGLVVPRDENILQPFRSPELAAFAPDAIEPKRHWVVVRESYTGIGFNTKLLPADKAPKTYRRCSIRNGRAAWRSPASRPRRSTGSAPW